MTTRTLRILVLSYAVKSLFLGIAWLMVPDLPQRAASKIREVWSGRTETAETTRQP